MFFRRTAMFFRRTVMFFRRKTAIFFRRKAAMFFRRKTVIFVYLSLFVLWCGCQGVCLSSLQRMECVVVRHKTAMFLLVYFCFFVCFF